VAYLGTKADADINFLTKADMVGFRDALAAKLSATAARHAFKGSRMIFRAARMDGILSFDPRETVKPTKKADTARRTRRPFTVQETHKILSTCDDEWRGW
jgi:integrase